MLIQPYELDELHFAYCYRVFMRWRTYRARPIPSLAALSKSTLTKLVEGYDIHVLECATNPTDLLLEVSLKPNDTISIAASKLKGKVSGWIRGELDLKQPERLLSAGYFACTVGNSTSRDVEKYLSEQAVHHGYAQRRLPPVYSERFEPDESHIIPKHASVISRFHCVLATSWRKGVFGSVSGEQLTAEWKKLQAKRRFVLRKVSFVPDHVHLALRLHPAVSPAETIVDLMNVSQEFMKRELVTVGIDRLWQPSAYIGSYGDLASPQIRKYIENWEYAQLSA